MNVFVVEPISKIASGLTLPNVNNAPFTVVYDTDRDAYRAAVRQHTAAQSLVEIAPKHCFHVRGADRIERIVMRYGECR